jgi:hypothetical protein
MGVEMDIQLHGLDRDDPETPVLIIDFISTCLGIRSQLITEGRLPEKKDV